MDCYYGIWGYNVFDDEGWNRPGHYAIENYSGSDLYAQGNWWNDIDDPGGYPANNGFFIGNQVVYIPICDRPNSAGSSLLKTTQTEDPILKEFFDAFNQYKQRNYVSVKKLCKDFFDSYPQHDLAHEALRMLFISYVETNELEENVNFLNGIINNSNSDERCIHVARAWLIYYYAQKSKLKNAEKVALEAPVGSYSERELLLTVLAEYVNVQDTDNADRIVQILQGRNYPDPIQKDIQIILASGDDGLNKGLAKSEQQEEEQALINYPNPFNSSTQIRYNVSKDGMVNVSIYNILGQKVKTLVSMNKQSGLFSTTWDGKDEGGNEVPTGIYFIHFKTSNKNKTIKISYLK